MNALRGRMGEMPAPENRALALLLQLIGFGEEPDMRRTLSLLERVRPPSL